MNHRRIAVLLLGGVLLSFAMLTALAVTPVVSAKKVGKAKIVWSQNPVRAQVAPGDTYSATVSFTSNVDLANAQLDWTSSLSGTTTLNPTTFPTIMVGVPYSVQVTFTAPTDGTRAQYNGVVHLRTGQRNYPSNLKLRFAVPVSPTISVQE